jgi:hypothetical protein
MSKQTALDKAIAQIDGEIAVLQAARERLMRQQPKTPKRPRAVDAPVGEKTA